MSNYIHGEITEVYWKLYRINKTDLVTVICLQSFDEYDYNESQFIKNSSGNHHRFGTEELAISFLNEKFDESEIDPEYLIKNINKNVGD